MALTGRIDKTMANGIDTNAINANAPLRNTWWYHLLGLLWIFIFTGLCGGLLYIRHTGTLAIGVLYTTAGGLISFLLLGVLFTWMFYYRAPFFRKWPPQSSLGYLLFTFLCVFWVLFSLGYWQGEYNAVASLQYSCVFLLPAEVFEAWLVYQRIPTINQPWYLPDLQHANPPAATVFLNSLQLKVMIKPAAGQQAQAYNTVAPGRMLLGTLFYQLILDEKTAGNLIQTEDGAGKPYGWQFFAASRGLYLRNLNPLQSLDENKLQTGSTVVIKRVGNLAKTRKN
jgi:hypothetical protein